MGHLPDIPDQPGVDLFVLHPPLLGDAAIGRFWKDPVFSEGANHADVASSSGDIFPEPGLSRASDSEHLRTRLRQIVKAPDILWMTESNQDRTGTQVGQKPVQFHGKSSP
jgi:hypothetical protein